MINNWKVIKRKIGDTDYTWQLEGRRNHEVYRYNGEIVEMKIWYPHGLDENQFIEIVNKDIKRIIENERSE